MENLRARLYFTDFEMKHYLIQKIFFFNLSTNINKIIKNIKIYIFTTTKKKKRERRKKTKQTNTPEPFIPDIMKLTHADIFKNLHEFCFLSND